MLYVGDGSGEATDPSDPKDAGEPLVGGGEVPELPPLGVVSDVGEDGSVEAGGLVDAVDGVELGNPDGVPALEGPSVDEGPPSELGSPDVGDAGLLPAGDPGDVLGAD